MAPSSHLLALQYGLRLDASPDFIQGYVDGMRLDQRGQGVACGRGWIPRSKKCSRDKASQTSKEAKAKTVERAKARGKLKGEVKAAKGQKPRIKEKPIAPSKTFEMVKAPKKKPRGESARLAATKPLEAELSKVIDLFAAGSLSFGRENRIIDGAREGLIILNSSKQMPDWRYEATYNQVKKDVRNLYTALNEKPYMRKQDSTNFYSRK